MMPYIRNKIQSGFKRVTNSKKSSQIPGHGKKTIVEERIKLLSNNLEPVIHYHPVKN